MAEPRKIFRIEQTAASRHAPRRADTSAPAHNAALTAEIAALRALLAPPQPSMTAAARYRQTQRLTSELNLIAGAIAGGGGGCNGASSGPAGPMTRIGHELEEVVNSTAQATQAVLTAAEAIDQVAQNLSAALTGKFEQGLAQDVHDLVIKIYEACNFQDLTGQRITKVLSILDFVETHVARMLDEINNPATARRDGEQYLHGPRLESDSGHATQAEIDRMFEF
jgi:chemotaxis protein CheZ